MSPHATVYRVAGYCTRRAYLLDRPRFTVVVSEKPGEPPALERAQQRARELGEMWPDLRHFRIEPVPARPAT